MLPVSNRLSSSAPPSLARLLLGQARDGDGDVRPFLMRSLGTLQGFGPFASETPFTTLLSLQSFFMGVVSVTSMVVAASTARTPRRRRIWSSTSGSSKPPTRSSPPSASTTRSRASRTAARSRSGCAWRPSSRASAPACSPLLIVDVDRFRHHNQILGHGGRRSPSDDRLAPRSARSARPTISPVTAATSSSSCCRRPTSRGRAPIAESCRRSVASGGRGSGGRSR